MCGRRSQWRLPSAPWKYRRAACQWLRPVPSGWKKITLPVWPGGAACADADVTGAIPAATASAAPSAT